MRLEWCDLGDRLLLAGTQCRYDMVLIAPFMKAQTLRRIVAPLSLSVRLLCITRWRLEELAAGVSDLECWDLVCARDNSRFLLHQDLHAKYFRFDDIAFVGSANLTMTALGWSARPNAEALLTFHVNDVDSTIAFESTLLHSAVEVSRELAANFKSLLDRYSSATRGNIPLAPPPLATLDQPTLAPIGTWLPRSRSPEYLFHVYCGNSDEVSTEGLLAAQEDLLYLDAPPRLSEAAFNQLIQSRLAVCPVVLKLDQFLTAPRRFGEIRLWLAAELKVPDATDTWQRLMRWLLVFSPDRYEYATPRYSEIFRRK